MSADVCKRTHIRTRIDVIATRCAESYFQKSIEMRACRKLCDNSELEMHTVQTDGTIAVIAGFFHSESLEEK
uniref:Apple domain-containing protein n=1 Tax=Ascaris lumbricoides TaxID=6252 RepID=A0A0M3IHW8_ASCLU